MTIKPHIIIIGPAYPYRGGIASFIHRLGEEYQSQGYSVEIVTFTYQYPGLLFPGTSQFNSGPNPTAVPIRRMIHSLNPFSWIRAGRYVRKQQPHRVLFNFWLPFFGFCFGIISRLAKNPRTQVTGLMHNFIPHEPRPFDRIFTKFFTKSVDNFVVMSQSVKKQMEDFRPNQKIVFNPHPIYDNYGEPVNRNTACEQLGLDPDYRYILFFGFIRKYKGLDLAIQSMNDPYFANNKIRLLIAGEYYDHPDIYKRLIQSLHQQNTIIEKTEFIPDDKVKYYFCASDLVLQPYRNATQSGISQLAIYFEKPMVVTNVGGLQEIIGNSKGGFVVQSRPQAIRMAVIQYFDQNLGAKFTRHIRSIKPLFTWSNLVNCIESI